MSKSIKFFYLILIVLFTALLSPINIKAQVVGSETLQFRDFTFHNKSPKYLTSRKSAVFISVPRSNKNPAIRSDWKDLATSVHAKLKRMKIDPVAYYYTDDAFNNSDPSIAFAKEMTKREIKYLIFVSQIWEKKNAETEEKFTIIVTPFNNESSFVDQGANAWKIENNDFNALFKEMFNTIYKAEHDIENYLIPDIPEFFTDVNIIKGKRIPTYAMDLKVEKLIVPKFQKYIPKDSSKLDEFTLNEIALYNSEIDKKNDKLQTIMKTYHLPYEISDDYLDKNVYDNGGQFVLLRLEGTGETIKDLLNYKTEPGETVFATIKATDVGSTVLRLPAEAVVSKYYVKHVYTKDVYTGLKWDADLTWEESLKNFIFHMKDILNVK
ncbi:MAG: hypothetical protein JXR07_08965 [Reichenbachiella sp.]